MNPRRARIFMRMCTGGGVPGLKSRVFVAGGACNVVGATRRNFFRGGGIGRIAEKTIRRPVGKNFTGPIVRHISSR